MEEENMRPLCTVISDLQLKISAFSRTNMNVTLEKHCLIFVLKYGSLWEHPSAQPTGIHELFLRSEGKENCSVVVWAEGKTTGKVVCQPELLFPSSLIETARAFSLVRSWDFPMFAKRSCCGSRPYGMGRAGRRSPNRRAPLLLPGGVLALKSRSCWLSSLRTCPVASVLGLSPRACLPPEGTWWWPGAARCGGASRASEPDRPAFTGGLRYRPLGCLGGEPSACSSPLSE